MLAAIAAAMALIGADGSAPEPLLYDLVINGESFTIEANRTNKLQSRRHPGTVYEVALRVAQVQRLALNTMQADYDRGFRVRDDRGRPLRTATLEHELGFTLVLTDLGADFDDAGRQKVLGTLKASMEKTLAGETAGKLQVSEPFESQFAGGKAHGLSIRYSDAQGIGRTCLVYVLGDQKSACSCIVQLVDADRDDVLPLVKKTLDSIRSR
jgi:hypothetical protein